MKEIKDNYTYCADCNKEFNENEGNGDNCPFCGSIALEECETEEWKLLSDEEKADYIQYKEDCTWYDSVRV